MGNVVKFEHPIPEDGNLYFGQNHHGEWRCLNTINENLKKAEIEK